MYNKQGSQKLLRLHSRKLCTQWELMQPYRFSSWVMCQFFPSQTRTPKFVRLHPIAPFNAITIIIHIISIIKSQRAASLSKASIKSQQAKLNMQTVFG